MKIAINYCVIVNYKDSSYVKYINEYIWLLINQGDLERVYFLVSFKNYC